VELVTSFFEMLYSFRVRQGAVDSICWIPSKRHKFEMKSYYHVLTIPTGNGFPVFLEEHLESKGPLKGSVLCVDNDVRKFFDI
jgi:hypothetical protein